MKKFRNIALLLALVASPIMMTPANAQLQVTPGVDDGNKCGACTCTGSCWYNGGACGCG